jgi:EF-P beta-lysylation protein EpmB
MIPRSLAAQQPPRWQQLLAQAITEPHELLSELGLPLELLPAASRASAAFRLQVPRGFVGRMRPGDASDPLLRQVLPLGEELATAAGYGPDPLQETQSMVAPGVLHKYRGRVLLTVTGACAIHCRYCFRRHYPYSQANAARDDAQTAMDYLRRHTDVAELILSGGDPLCLGDERLGVLLDRLAGITHLKRLRIHSRLPVVLPERIDPALLEWISTPRFGVVLVIHCNHAREIDASVRTALQKLRTAGVSLLNQAVLLRGVNDRLDSQAELSEQLFEAGVLPYYLHQLDPVQGAAHFAVSDSAARRLFEAMREYLPGYLLPRLVREIPRAPSKTPLLY